MKKKLIILFLTSTICLSLTSCGNTPTNSSDQVQEPSQIEETKKSESDAYVEEHDGIRLERISVQNNLNILGETGPLKYSVNLLSLGKITATTDESASFLQLEKNKEITTVAINVTGENTSTDTVDFFLGQAKLTSNTKEQVDPDMLLSEYVDGTYIGQVKQSGTLIYLLKNTNIDDLTQVSLHITEPYDENANTIGDKVDIDIPIK